MARRRSYRTVRTRAATAGSHGVPRLEGGGQAVLEYDRHRPGALDDRVEAGAADVDALAWHGLLLRVLDTGAGGFGSLPRSAWRPGPGRYNRLRCAAASWCLAGGLLVLAGWVSVPRAQSPPAAPCNVTTTERVVAIGDVHGAYDQFVAILRTAGLINTRDRWSGGRAVLVQTGDILDRGKDSRKVIELLRRLERDARGAGGQVIALTGNHEFMRLAGDWRYVSAGEYDAFRDGSSNELRDAVFARASAAAEERARAEKRPFDAAAYKEQFLREVPLGLIEMRQAFAAGAQYGDWMRARPAVARVNGIVFLHGGISDEVAALGCEAINDDGGRGHEDAARRPGSSRDAVLVA